MEVEKKFDNAQDTLKALIRCREILDLSKKEVDNGTSHWIIEAGEVVEVLTPHSGRIDELLADWSQKNQFLRASTAEETLFAKFSALYPHVAKELKARFKKQLTEMKGMSRPSPSQSLCYPFLIFLLRDNHCRSKFLSIAFHCPRECYEGHP